MGDNVVRAVGPVHAPLSVLAARIGSSKARRAWHRSVAAVQTLARLVRRERIRCGWSTKQSLYLAGDAYGARALRAEAFARGNTGISGTFLGARALSDRFGIDRTGALLSDGSASANPAHLTAGLLRRCVGRGATIHSNANVQTLHSSRRAVELALENGAIINAKHVVFCTGYELLPAIPLSGHVIKSTWAIATEPVVNLP